MDLRVSIRIARSSVMALCSSWTLPSNLPRCSSRSRRCSSRALLVTSGSSMSTPRRALLPCSGLWQLATACLSSLLHSSSQGSEVHLLPGHSSSAANLPANVSAAFPASCSKSHPTGAAVAEAGQVGTASTNPSVSSSAQSGCAAVAAAPSCSPTSTTAAATEALETLPSPPVLAGGGSVVPLGTPGRFPTKACQRETTSFDRKTS
mmetsp:Transcript_146001/g.406755  ORF Transcript_146001/g.406755 Transcript_146001/m.406755 type:complete len:206 (+) Transcript_146001:298-915(+)